MPAVLSSTGTFTGLSTPLTAYEDQVAPAPVTVALVGADLQTIPDEIRQMVRLFQDGWGAQLGAGKKLDFWVTVRMLELMLQAYKGQGIPRQGDRVA